MAGDVTETAQHPIKETLHRHKVRADEHKHIVNVVHHDEATFGERIADAASAGIGSWRFLIIQTFAVFLWVSLNIIGLIKRWDPFPFILLNLLFSVQAAYTGPVLLLAGNRQSQKDRLTLEHAAHEADIADRQNVAILKAIQKNTEITERNTEVTVQILRHVEALVSGKVAANVVGPQGEANQT
jgi:uncharacterized membrane protein